MDHIGGTADTNQGAGFDPGQAGALTDQATRQARRQSTPLTTLLWTFRAIAILSRPEARSSTTHRSRPWPPSR